MAPSLSHDEQVRRWYARYERLAIGPGVAAATYATMFDILVCHTFRPFACRPSSSTGAEIVTSGWGAAATWPGTSQRRSTSNSGGRDNLFHVGDTETMLGEIRRGGARGDR